MKKHFKPIIAYLSFAFLLSWYCVLTIKYMQVMMWVSIVIVAMLIYTAFYKAFNN